MTTSELQGIPKRLGHVALRVRDVDRAVAFYTDILGLQLKLQGPTPGQSPAFLSAGDDSSHELALMPLPPEAEGPDADRVGMYHMAWQMGSFEELEQLHERLKARDVKIVGYSEVQCNVMFLDPDGNELEAIWEPSPDLSDRPTQRLTP